MEERIGLFVLFSANEKAGLGEIDHLTNHRAGNSQHKHPNLGYFIFKLCKNNDVTKDPDQDCFEKHVLQVQSTLKYLAKMRFILGWETSINQLH